MPSKSEVQRFAYWLPAAPMRAVIDGLLQWAMQKPRQLGLKEALDLPPQQVPNQASPKTPIFGTGSQ